MWRVAVALMVVVVGAVEGIATPLRPPVSGYAGLTSSRQTVLVDPHRKDPHSPQPPTDLHPEATPSLVVVGKETEGSQKIRLRGPKYPLRGMNASGLLQHRFRQQGKGVRPWRKGGAIVGMDGRKSGTGIGMVERKGDGFLGMNGRKGIGRVGKGGRRMRPGVGRPGGASDRRRRPAGSPTGGAGRWRNVHGILRHRLTSPPIQQPHRDGDFLSQWHESYGGSQSRQHNAAEDDATTTPPTTTLPPPPETPVTQINGLEGASLHLSSLPVAAPSVHDMTSFHFTAQTNTTQRRKGGKGNRGNGKRRQNVKPQFTTTTRRPHPAHTLPAAPRTAPEASPGGSQILDSIQSIFKATRTDEDVLSSMKTVGNSSPRPLDIFSSIPVTTGFRPSIGITGETKDSDKRPRAPVKQSESPSHSKSHQSPNVEANHDPQESSQAAPPGPSVQGAQKLSTGNYLVHVGSPPPGAEYREGDGILLDEEDSEDVVVGRPAALIQAPRKSQPLLTPPDTSRHTYKPTFNPTHNHNPTLSPTNNPKEEYIPRPVHTLIDRVAHISPESPIQNSAHNHAHTPAHTLVQFPGSYNGPPKLLLGSVPPWAPEDMHPLVNFIKDKYGQAVPRVPSSVTSLQALISSGRVPEVFQGPQVIKEVKSERIRVRPQPLRKRGGKPWSGQVDRADNTKVESGGSSGQFVALSSLALLIAFCGYLLLTGAGNDAEPRGAVETLVSVVEEAKRGLDLLHQGLDEYEDHLVSSDEEDKDNDLSLQDVSEEPAMYEDIPTILTKIWDLLVPPEIRRKSGLLNFISQDQKHVNESTPTRGSKQISSLFSEPKNASLPSLETMKENGLTFMNRIRENGLELLLSKIKESGLDLVLLNGSDASGSSMLTSDRFSSAAHMLLNHLVDTKAANHFLDNFWSSVSGSGEARTNKTETNHNDEPVNSTISMEPVQKLQNRTSGTNQDRTTQMSEPVNQESLESSEPQQLKPKNQATTHLTSPKTNRSTTPPLPQEPAEPDFYVKSVGKPVNGGDRRTLKNSPEPVADRQMEPQPHNQPVNPYGPILTIDADNKSRNNEEIGNKLKENEKEKVKVESKKDEDEDKDNTREESGGKDNVNKDNHKKMDKSKSSAKKTTISPTKENEKESKKEDENEEQKKNKEDMSTHVRGRNEQERRDEEKEEESNEGEKKLVKVILNNRLHVGDIPHSSTSSSSSSTSSSSSSSLSRTSAFVNNVPLQSVPQ